MSKANIAILFGGISAEHEVSIISGLQVIENIDRQLFQPHAIYWAKDHNFYYYPAIENRQQWMSIKPQLISLGRDKHGVFLEPTAGWRRSKIYLAGAYLAFHGGMGESGQIQGLLESLDLPFTSPDTESSVITMNKALTKVVVGAAGIATIPGVNINSHFFRTDPLGTIQQVVAEVGHEVIIKPAHLGSSIGLAIAKSEIEIEKALSQAFLIDSAVVAEKLLHEFTEYNCSVRSHNGNIEPSEVERPFKQDEILSFADKYSRGGKKTAGMASLSRELPAKISQELKLAIQNLAVKAYQACQCSGTVRIDFMYTADDHLYLTEINPIPGSLSFYLWEASGISFRQQITDALDASLASQAVRHSRKLDYKTDIVTKFVKGN